MAVWELALLILAATYMMVNTVYMVIMVKTMNKYDGLFTKSVKMLEKMIDKSEKAMNDLFDDDDL